MSKPWHEMTALELGAGIASGAIDPVALCEHFFQRIEAVDPDRNIYVRLTKERALTEAKAAAGRRAAGLRLGPLDGVPVSWKDLFDTAGVATEAGTRIFAGRTPSRDALVVARATRAGMICLGKTSLPDFAFSGLGINPTCGTPANAHDEETPRVPGGSSAGAAVSVARGLAPIGIGSDTGGSVRIPAALNGLVGLKTTAGLIPLTGAVALSPTLDTIGPLTRDVADANAMLAVLAAARAYDLTGATLAGVRLLAPTNAIWSRTSSEVRDVFETALARLAQAGARIESAAIEEFDELIELTAERGNLISAEGYALWGAEMDAAPDKIYPPVYARFVPVKERSAVDVVTYQLALPAIRARYGRRVAGYHAVVMPTVPIVAPPIAGLIDDVDAHDEAAVTVAWNTRLGNLLGLSAITLPAGRASGLPVGLMAFGRPFGEGALLRLAKAAESALAS